MNLTIMPRHSLPAAEAMGPQDQQLSRFQLRQELATSTPSTVFHSSVSFSQTPLPPPQTHAPTSTMNPSNFDGGVMSNHFVSPSTTGNISHPSDPSTGASTSSSSPTLLTQSLRASQHNIREYMQQPHQQQQHQTHYPANQNAGGGLLQVTTAPPATAALSATNPYLSDATVVTNTVVSASSTSTRSAAAMPPSAASVSGTMGSFPPTVITASTEGAGGAFARTDRRHSMPSSIILRSHIPHKLLNSDGGTRSSNGVHQQQGAGSSSLPPPPTHPVPEFLCHLYSMLRDPALHHLISWAVPASDESAHCGGGKAGIGKIIVHDPTRLQNEVLGNYYRHSKYSSFQRQLNYFGFKKRLHGSRKGKLCPCSFVHDTLGTDPVSLLNLKRRPPSNGKSKAVSNNVLSPKKHQEQAGSSVGSGGSSSKSSSKKRPLPKENNLVGSLGVPHHMSDQRHSWSNDGLLESKPQATAPLNMPIMAQATPGLSWAPAAPCNTILTGNNNGMAMPATTASPSLQYPSGSPTHQAETNDKDYMSRLQDVNKANVLEAKKSLMSNFLKSQQEQQARQQPGESSGQSAGQQPQMAPAHLLNSISAVPPPQQQPQQQAQVFVQQQPMILPQNCYPSIHPFSSQVDLNKVFMQPASEAQNSLMGQVAMPASIGTSAPALTFSTSLANGITLPQVSAGFLNTSSFPVNKTPLVGNNFGQAACDAMKTTTNTLTAPAPAPNNTAVSFSSIGTTQSMLPPMTSMTSSLPIVAAGNKNSNGNIEGTQQEFNDMLSNLLSTALPPSDELFDDDMSAGNISDCFDDDGSSSMDMGLVGGHLQVADDGRAASYLQNG